MVKHPENKKIVRPTTLAGRKRYKQRSWEWSHKREQPTENISKCKNIISRLSGNIAVFREGAYRSADGRYYCRTRTGTVRDTISGQIFGGKKSRLEIPNIHWYGYDTPKKPEFYRAKARKYK